MLWFFLWFLGSGKERGLLKTFDSNTVSGVRVFESSLAMTLQGSQFTTMSVLESEIGSTALSWICSAQHPSYYFPHFLMIINMLVSGPWFRFRL